MKSSKAPDGVSRNPFGKVVLRSREYHSWLHDQLASGEIRPFNGELYRGETVDLHHFSQERRSNDAWVVALPRSIHEQIENNPKAEAAYRDPWFAWAIFQYWKFVFRNHPCGGWDLPLPMSPIDKQLEGEVFARRVLDMLYDRRDIYDLLLF